MLRPGAEEWFRLAMLIGLKSRRQAAKFGARDEDGGTSFDVIANKLIGAPVYRRPKEAGRT